ncbi:hypothetical protein RYX36_019478, partial [Vicia faba]
TAIFTTWLFRSAVPTLLAFKKAAESLEKVMDTAREELPDTMSAVRLSTMEISDLTSELSDLGQEITQGVRSSTRAVRSVEQGLRSLTTMPSSSASLLGMEYSSNTEPDSSALAVGRTARVDRVIEYNPGVSAVAIKNVTINDNFFPGHFPERPIMPGVLMVEALAQVGGLVMLQPEVGGSRENFFFAGIDKVRFRKPVIAGDTLVMRMTLIKLQKRFGIAKMEGKAYVGGEVVCEGDFLMATGSSSE